MVLSPNRVPRPTTRALVCAVSLICGLFAGCARTDPQDRPIRVHGAASLATVLPELFEDPHREVEFSFDATSRLAATIADGAPADVFVAADREWMVWLADQGYLDLASARVIASNRLVVATRTGSGVKVGTLSDLTHLPPRSVALAGEQVPAGRYAQAALENAGIWAELADQVLRGASVRSAAEWVATGEVAVGLLYRTDVVADPRLEELYLVDVTLHPTIEYLAAPLTSTTHAAAAADAIARMSGPTSSSLWLARGFEVGTMGSDLPQSLPTLAAPSNGSFPSIRAAVARSLGVGLLATLLGLAPALGLGWLLARKDFPGKSLISTLTLVPLVVPPVVTGFLLLWAFGARSPVGQFLMAAGIQVPFTTLGAVVAAAVVGFPLYVLTIRAAFESVDRRYEDLAATLGDPPLKSFMRISLPLALPGIAAAAVLAFARGLGEFGATIVLAGNLEGSTRTIPLAVYTLLESPGGRSQVWILVGASVGLCLIALIGFEVLSKRLRTNTEGWRG